MMIRNDDAPYRDWPITRPAPPDIEPIDQPAPTGRRRLAMRQGVALPYIIAGLAVLAIYGLSRLGG